MFLSFFLFLISVCRSTSNHPPIKYNCSFKMNNQVRHAYLKIGLKSMGLLKPRVCNDAIQCFFFTCSPPFHLTSYFILPFNVTYDIKNCLPMTSWENLNLSHKIEDQIIFFQKKNIKKFELLIILSPY